MHFCPNGTLFTLLTEHPWSMYAPSTPKLVGTCQKIDRWTTIVCMETIWSYTMNVQSTLCPIHHPIFMKIDFSICMNKLVKVSLDDPPQKFEFQRCYWNVLRHFKGISTHYIRITWTCCFCSEYSSVDFVVSHELEACDANRERPNSVDLLLLKNRFTLGYFEL